MTRLARILDRYDRKEAPRSGDFPFLVRIARASVRARHAAGRYYRSPKSAAEKRELLDAAKAAECALDALLNEEENPPPADLFALADAEGGIDRASPAGGLS